MKLYTIKYDDGKQFNEFPIFDSDTAKRELEEAIKYMDGDNWCGLHIEEEPVNNAMTLHEFMEAAAAIHFGGPVGLDDLTDEDYEMFENMYYGGNDYDGCL